MRGSWPFWIAKDAGSFVDFEEALIASPAFTEVYPTSETNSAAQRGVGFDLVFRYLPRRALAEGAEELEPPAGGAATAADESGAASAVHGEAGGTR